MKRRNGAHSRRTTGGVYLCGPLARFALNHQQLSPLALEAAREAGLEAPCRDAFRSIVVRSVELLYACDESLRLIDAYEEPDEPFVPVEPVAGTGYGVSEAPRGLLYHRYELDDEGRILDARIIPSTAQNQRAIEDDLRRFVEAHLDLEPEHLTWHVEEAVRNYDPCISCATHFLELEVDR